MPQTATASKPLAARASPKGSSASRAAVHPSDSCSPSPMMASISPAESTAATSSGEKSKPPSPATDSLDAGVAHAVSLITPSTRSRFSCMSSSLVAPRLRRSSGSVLEGRTLKCQSV